MASAVEVRGNDAGRVRMKVIPNRPRYPTGHQKADDPNPTLPRAHRAIVSNEHLQVYMDEFTYRYNRRGKPMPAFRTALGLGAQPDQGPRLSLTGT